MLQIGIQGGHGYGQCFFAVLAGRGDRSEPVLGLALRYGAKESPCHHTSKWLELEASVSFVKLEEFELGPCPEPDAPLVATLASGGPSCSKRRKLPCAKPGLTGLPASEDWWLLPEQRRCEA